MALIQAGNLAALIAVAGVLSFISGIIAENKKPAQGVATGQGDFFSCVYEDYLYLLFGALSVILLAATSVLGVVSILFPYNSKAVPVVALARSELLVAFIIISSTLFLVAEALLLWAIITEGLHWVHHIHTTAHCPTAKTGLMGGAAFLALDTTLFWLVCQMLTVNARANYFELEDDEGKGSYGYTPDYMPVTTYAASKV